MDAALGISTRSYDILTTMTAASIFTLGRAVTLTGSFKILSLTRHSALTALVLPFTSFGASETCLTWSQWSDQAESRKAFVARHGEIQSTSNDKTLDECHLLNLEAIESKLHSSTGSMDFRKRHVS